MPGKLCKGDIETAKVKESKAFCEGMLYRSTDTALNAPKTDNPHASGSDDATAWDAGWDVADAAAGGNIGKADAGCCAMGGVAVSV